MITKILVLDDESTVHQTLKTTVFNSEDDYFLWEAYDEDDVIKILESCNDESIPDICIFDIILDREDSESKDGITIAKKLLRKYKKIPIIFLSDNYDNAEFEERVSDLGISPYQFVPKTVIRSPANFRKMVESTISKNINEVQYLLLSHRKIGIPTKMKGTIPIEYTFYAKEEILYFLATEGICYIYTTDKIDTNNTDSKYIKLRPHRLATSAARINRQLKVFFDCFLSCGTRENIIVNIEQIKKIDADQLIFDGNISMQIPVNLQLKDVIEEIRETLKNKNMLLATKK